MSNILLATIMKNKFKINIEFKKKPQKIWLYFANFLLMLLTLPKNNIKIVLYIFECCFTIK